MEELSLKAKIVYATMEMLNATKDNKITSYNILDFIEENEELQDNHLIKEISEEDFVDAIMDLNIKSINTLIASMCRKNLIEKTEPESIIINGRKHNLRKYFIKKQSKNLKICNIIYYNLIVKIKKEKK